MHARAREQRAFADALVGMAAADEAVERKASVAPRARTELATVAAAHTVHAAAAPHPSLHSGAGVQLAQIAAAGNAAEKALLAEVTDKNPDASYVELLRLFNLKVRRSVADGHS
jgi:hypothetical protein